MAKQTIVVNGSYVPTLEDMKKVDANFTENYSSIESIETDVSSIESDITDLKAGEGITLVEYADNAAAVSDGLSVGDLYMTTGAVKVVTA